MHHKLGLIWYDSAATAQVPAAPAYLLLESGGFILLETGNKLLFG
jgi:hypothetical protein